NNHIWDYGKDALLDTLKILKENNILSVGAVENLDEANSLVIKEVRENKIGFLAYTDLYSNSFEAGRDYPGISSFDLEKVSKQISEIKASGAVDIIFVSLHWGDEYEGIAGEKQKEISRKLIDAGADVIVGHHPHVVQEFEEYGGGLIFYSLGNFVFDQNFSEETMSGYLVKIKIFDKKISDWEVVETKINKDFQVEMRYN
ncbi:MAG: CapA family protein, partial [Minisyncoccota bacterium]